MNTELMTTLHFSAEDLASNRTGKMSTIQSKRLGKQLRRSIIIGFVAMLVVALMATTFLFLSNQQQTSPILSLVGWSVAILNAVMMGMFLRHWLRLNADIQSGSVTTVCGETTFTVRMLNKRTALYLVRVENESGFAETDVSRTIFEALRRHKGMYCFYRTPYTGKLLSLEALEK